MFTREILQRTVLGLCLVSGPLGCETQPTRPLNGRVPMAPMSSAEPNAQPSAMPSVGETVPCDPVTSVLAPLDQPWWGHRSRESVLLGRCRERFIQRLGQPPQALGFGTDDFAIDWVALDGSVALGTRHIPPTTSHLIKRFADGRPDQVLRADSVERVCVSPDGKIMALISPYRESQANLVLMSAETGEVRDIGVLALGTWMQWSPDGQRLMYQQRNLEVALEDPTDVARPIFSLAWTSWEEPTSHRLPGDAAVRYDLHRGMVTWAPDSRRLLIFDQNLGLMGKRANLVTVTFDGQETSRPLLDVQGQPINHFTVRDIAPDNRLVLGNEGLLDIETGRVAPLDTTHLLRWSLVPGKFLRWRTTPDGPVLDTVAAPSL